MNPLPILPGLSLALLLQGMAIDALAAVSLGGTRLVFSGHFAQVAIEAHNGADHEVLLQAWLGKPGDERAAETTQPHRDLPFVVTPALARLPAGGRQALQVLYQGSGMPTDRESLLHLYVLEVPRRSEAGQQMTIAVRQRINVFYRPPGLPGDPAMAPRALQWSQVADDSGLYLRVDNPGAYHVALLDVQLADRTLRDYLLLAPGARFDWPLPAGQGGPLRFKALTDYGGQRTYCVQATGQAPFTARLLKTPQMAEDC